MNQYIMVETVNDEFNKPRDRKLFHPGICDECGHDILEECTQIFTIRFGTIKYDELPPEGKVEVTKEIAHHKIVWHQNEKKRIIPEDELTVGCSNGVNETVAQRRVADDRKMQREAEKKAAIAEKLGLLQQQNQPQVIYVQAPLPATSRLKRTRKTVLKPTVITENKEE